MIALSASGLCRRYGRRWALIDVGFELPEGSLAMVTGRNGAGKSTLLRVLATALRPDQGTASVAGHDIRAERLAARACVALLGHRTRLYGPLTAIENLRLHARLLGLPPQRARLLATLEEVGLADRADDPVQILSAGMGQRLALALVMQKESKVVLLDEPYNHLDPPGFEMVDRLLCRLRARGSTVLMATHLVERGRMLCDRALVLEGGRVRFGGLVAQMPGRATAAAFAEGG
jgi:heme ABC exporter ATP-binding subunit CcmA